MERDIKRALLAQGFGDPALRKGVIERLLGLRKEAGVALSAGVLQATIQPGDEAERQQERIRHALETCIAKGPWSACATRPGATPA